MGNVKEQIAPGLESFAKEFLVDREIQLGQMDRYVQEKKFEEIASLCHQWKSFCAPYGFSGLGDIAIMLEKSAKEIDKDKCLHLIEEAKQYLANRKKQIENL